MKEEDVALDRTETELTPSILFVDHTGAMGGAELYLLDLAAHIRRNALVVLFEDGPFYKRLVERGVAVTVLPAPVAMEGISREGGLGHAFRALPGIVRLARRLARQAQSFDMLYANSQKALIVSVLAGLIARRPVVWNLHDILSADHFGRAHVWTAVGLANHGVARVIANSEATKAAFVAAGGRAARVRVIHNGIAPAPFQQIDPAVVSALRISLGLESASVVGVFSRLAPWKGQHVLLDALVKLPTVHAVLVGEALFAGDRAYCAQLKQQIERLGLEGRVHFLGFRDDIPQLLHMVDVVVHTSVAPEPFGRVIVEGMMAGRPVVATEAGGAREIVSHEETGLLVPPGNAEALAQAIAGLLAVPGRATRLARAGQADALRRFALPLILEKLEQQLREVRASTPRRKQRKTHAPGRRPKTTPPYQPPPRSKTSP